MKKNNKKGFTLAELLIVVAIIAVLVAIAIPVFSAQLEKSRDATTVANIRSAYAEATTAYLTNDASAANVKSVTTAADGKTTAVVVENIKWMDTDGDISSASADLPFTVTGGSPGNSQKNATMTFTYTNADGSVAASVDSYA